jgi:hypothetical protein
MHKRHVLAGLLTLVAIGASPNAQNERPPGETLVRSFVAAYNAHDVPAMMAFCADDIRWLSVTGDKMNIETESAKLLAEAMQRYFKLFPSSQSEQRSLAVSGPFVSTVEEARWETKNGMRKQCSIGVYELANGKIKNVWYFPAHAC